jgi:Ca2+-binding RTX toxin-like protein
VVLGSAADLGAVFELSYLDGNNGFKIAGAAEGDTSGISVSAAGDVNGDGFADLIVGAPDADVGDNYGAGISYVIFGGMPGEAVDRTGTNIANTIHGGDFHDALSGLGGGDTLIGHGGKDTIRGGKGDDTIIGGAGRDGLDGGGGADVFRYEAVSDSTSTGADFVARFNFNVDKFDVAVVNAIDAAIETGALSKATLDADLAAAVDAAHLGADNAVIFTPDSGDLVGTVVLVIDVNGDAGYQAGEDLVIELLNAKNLGALGTEDFI